MKTFFDLQKIIPNIPRIEINKSEEIWLKEIWDQIMTIGVKPTYQDIRKRTIERTGAGFDPHKIDNRLVKENALTITLLAALYIEESIDILFFANKIIFYIKDQLINNRKDYYNMADIANAISANEQHVKVIFTLLSETAGELSSSMGTTDQKKFGWDSFGTTYPGNFEKYISLTSVEELLNKEFKQNIKLDNEMETNNEILFINNDGHLIFNEDKLFEKIRNEQGINIKKYVNAQRIDELKKINTTNYDFSKLIIFCNELNVSFTVKNYYSVVLLTRALIDHIPPLFGKQNFSEIANNYKSDGNERSFKKAMQHLDMTLRSIADGSMHSLIRKSEMLLNETQVDFSNDLDILLSEIIRLHK